MFILFPGWRMSMLRIAQCLLNVLAAENWDTAITDTNVTRHYVSSQPIVVQQIIALALPFKKKAIFMIFFPLTFPGEISPTLLTVNEVFIIGSPKTCYVMVIRR